METTEFEPEEDVIYADALQRSNAMISAQKTEEAAAMDEDGAVRLSPFPPALAPADSSGDESGQSFASVPLVPRVNTSNMTPAQRAAAGGGDVNMAAGAAGGRQLAQFASHLFDGDRVRKERPSPTPSQESSPARRVEPRLAGSGGMDQDQ